MSLNTVLPSVSVAQHLLTPIKTDQSVGLLNHRFGSPGGNWHSVYYQAIGGPGSGNLFFRLYPDLPTNKTRRFPSLIVFSSALTAYANRKECAQGYRGLRS
jgi:hypothetical protein